MKAIFLEAGHGKSVFGTADNGACRTFDGKLYRERDFNKEIVRRLESLLKAKPELGKTLIQTVGLQTDTTPSKKMAFVNQTIRENKFGANECLSVSIHMNASVLSTPRGFEVWYQKGKGKAQLLGNDMVESMAQYNVVPPRPRPLMSTSLNSTWHRLYIDDALCPAVLIEAGFISNITDMSKILNNFDRVAESIAHGLLTYIRSHE